MPCNLPDKRSISALAVFSAVSPLPIAKYIEERREREEEEARFHAFLVYLTDQYNRAFSEAYSLPIAFLEGCPTPPGFPRQS